MMGMDTWAIALGTSPGCAVGTAMDTPGALRLILQ